MSYENLTYAVDQGVARITLDRPERLNALGGALLRELLDALEAAKASPEVGCILLTGAGRGFCSGADLADDDPTLPRDARGLPEFGRVLRERYDPIVLGMRSATQPVVAAVNGVAAGAGCSLALMADLTVAARSATFLQAFVNIGLLPDAGSTWVLPRSVGSQRALGMAMLGEPLDAETAHRWGLIWQVVDDDALDAEATALARRLASGPRQALARIKRAVHAATEHALPEQLALESSLQTECGATEDFLEGVSAFLEKRTAKFRGR